MPYLSYTIIVISYLSVVGAYQDLRANTWYYKLLSLSPLPNPYHLVLSGHAKPDDWHAVFTRQNSISSPNSKW